MPRHSNKAKHMTQIRKKINHRATENGNCPQVGLLCATAGVCRSLRAARRPLRAAEYGLSE